MKKQMSTGAKKSLVKITEQDSGYNLSEMSTYNILQAINSEDAKIHRAVKKVLPQIESLITACVKTIKKGGKIIYVGAGTSGRLGVMDASECPPTFGVPHDVFIALIAGGNNAIRHAVEGVEDDYSRGWEDVSLAGKPEDMVIGISSSGTTPYVLGALEGCIRYKLKTGCIVCNPGSPIATVAQFPVVVITGPEILRSSTRMKAGTATKMVLNMVSTTTMVKTGKVKGNKMIFMNITNDKLFKRGIDFIVEESKISQEEASELLKKHRNVQSVLVYLKKRKERQKKK